uniref:B30.2/SPRY domain-containing protein n=1 Tax=Poecilia reticulata TaxID=8081 RepID=A0A3P9Q9Q9_POERE
MVSGSSIFCLKATELEKGTHSPSLFPCLDPNTAFENLLLSEENTKVTWTKKAQEYPYRTERFTKYDQVLCAEGLSGVCYWEVEWKGPRVEVAVCYKGKDSCFGHNTLSWKIICSPSGCTFWHNSLHKGLIPPAQSRRVGVHLEYNEGKLSFYSVSRFGELTLLHRVQTTFSEPLSPGFSVDLGASLTMCTF